MKLCDRCHEPVGPDAEEIGDDIYCGACAETIHTKDAEYQELLDSYDDEEGEL